MPRKSVAREWKATVLSVVRSGSDTVLWTEPCLGLGNLLYLWLQAHLRTAEGRATTALWRPEMTPWTEVFPLVSELTTHRDAVGLRTRRELGFFQGWGIDYLPGQLHRFTADLVDSATVALSPRSQRTVVNVRRGDFFHDAFRGRFGFDQVAYLRAALDRSVRTSGPIEEIFVVSDDISWCRAELPWLQEWTADLRFSDEDSTALEDFVALAEARRLILTNSTFGYWAAHVSNHLYRDNHADIVVPWFHDRSVWSGAAYQLDPSWTVVRDVPGGWGDPS